MPKQSLPASVRKLITERKRAKNARESLQPRLIENRDIFKAQIVEKLHGLARGPQWANFQRCGVEEIYATCTGCGFFERYYYACNRKWCPLCNYKLSQARAERIKIWAKHVHQPKHVVLTMRNFAVLTRTVIRRFQKALVSLRRQNVWAESRGGCCSIEVTNSGQGWHLHAHILVDAYWIDAGQLAIVWGKLIGQEFGIVKVKDVRGVEYVQEVAKYCAKGSEMAEWAGEQLLEFITAIRGVRFFAAFGSLREARKEIELQLRFSRIERKKCSCGCTDRVFETDERHILSKTYFQRRDAPKSSAAPLHLR